MHAPAQIPPNPGLAQLAHLHYSGNVRYSQVRQRNRNRGRSRIIVRPPPHAVGGHEEVKRESAPNCAPNTCSEGGQSL
jgi:hypothetical protein